MMLNRTGANATTQDSAACAVSVSGRASPQPARNSLLRSQASRLALLSAIGIATAAGASLLAPSQARAACVVGAVDVVCDDTITTDTTYPANPPVDRNHVGPSAGPLTLTVTPGATVSGHGLAITNTGTGGVIVTNNGAIVVTAGNTPTAGGTAALSVTATGGPIIYTGGAITNNGAGNAFDATQTGGAGSVNLNITGDVVAAAGAGVNVRDVATSTGISVTTGAVTALTLNLSGVEARSVSTAGDLTVLVNGDVQAGGAGVVATNFAAAATGDISVTTNGSIAGIRGIDARNAGSGSVSITANGAINASSGTAIIAETSGGAVTVVAGNVTSMSSFGITAQQTSLGGGAVNVTAGEVSGTTGILVFNAGTGAVTVTANGAVTGTTNQGIDVRAAAGATVIVADTVTGAANGLLLYGGNGGAGDISVTGTGGFVGGTGDAANIDNRGSGTVTVDISGPSSSAGGAGIVVRDTAAGGDISVTTGAVTALAGARNAIDVRTDSTTADVTVVANGDLQADDFALLARVNDAAATGDIAVTANGAINAGIGIQAVNFGAGAISVTAIGPVNASSSDGIYTQSAGGDITVVAGAVTSIGSTAIAAQQTLPGSAGSIDVTAGEVSGAEGILAFNAGTGAVTITTNGTVTGTSNDGIRATGQDAVTIVAAATVTGADQGLSLTGGAGGAGNISVTGTGGFVGGTGNGATIQNDGSGTVTVAISGASGSTGGEGINVRDTVVGGDISVTTGAVTALTAGMDGIDVQSLSFTADVTVIANGDLQAGNAGIVAVLGLGAAGDIGVSANGAIDALLGIDAENQGSGAVTVTTVGPINASSFGIYALSNGGDITVVAGDVTSTTSGGIFAQQVNAAGGGIVAVTAGEVSGAEGILAFNAGSGAVVVTANGSVTGATVEGIQAIGNAAVTVTVADTVTGATTGLSLTGGTGGTGDISVAGAGGFIGGSGDAANIRNNGAGSTTVSISGASSSAGGEGIVVRDTIAGGDISVTTGAVTALAAGMDGIDIQSLSLTGDVAVFANGNVQAGNAGIVAALVSAGATGNVEVTANGSVTGTFGIDAENLGSGSVAVAAVGPVNASNFGIYALSNGGAITVIADDVTSTASGAILAQQVNAAGAGAIVATADEVSGVFGILADNDGTGAVTITANGGVTGTAGDAIIATATSGAVQVLANGGAIVSTGGNGIRASTSAGGSVEIIGEGLIDASDGYGILADTAGGAITIDYNGDIGMAGDPTGGDGVLGIVNSGVGAIDISIVGEVHTTGLGLYGLGVGGLNLGTGGDVAVVYQGALAGPPVGVAAVIFNPANGEDASVTIGDGSTITAANTGVTAQTVGTGDATVTLGAGVTIDPDDYGILSVSLGGDATAVSGDGNTIIVTNTDGDDTAYGVFALSGQAADDAVGDESVEILIGADNSITIDDGAGGDADGAGGIVGVATGALGGVDIDAGDGLTVAITGNSAAGVSSTTIGGDIFVTTGTGSIDVVGLDSIDLTGNFGGSVGINAQSDTGSILIQSATDIAVDNGTLVATGIFAQTGGAGVVTVVSTGQVLSSGTGISAQAIDGDVLVSSSSVIGAGSGHGILAVNRGAGDTSVLATASITSTLSNGITAANTGTGFVFVDASGGTITAGGDGIFALANDVTNSRIVQVNNTSTITANTAAVGGFGIHAIQSGSGGMLINNGGVISGSAQNGIVTVNDATVGGITIFNTGAGIGSAVDPIGDNGIVATQVNAAGAGSINIQSTGGPIFATTGGIVADANGSGAVQIFTSASSAITTVGAGSIGIRADANGGLLEIAANGAITSGGSGIVATNVGGMTTVSTTDAITATGGSGINAATSGAVLTVSNFAAVSGVVNGMLAVNGGTGTTVVNASANVTGSGAGAGGIVATTGGTGAITVNVANGAAVSGTNGSGIRTTSVGGSPVIVNIGTGGVAVPATLVTGLGTGAGSWVLDLNNAAGSTTTVNIASNGVVRSTDATVTGYDDLAIRGIGGSVVINNAGRINGRVLFSGLTGNVVFNNTSFNSWHTTGASTFSGGADVLNNSGAIFTNAGGVATSFDFGAGADTFTNSGLLVVGEPTLAASTLTITNLEAWNNSGRIVFGSAGTDMTALSDGQINDRILASGATFTGSGSSRLVMDANLGATSQTSCAVLAAADCLSLTGGSTAGSTLIRVNDASGNAFGAFNPTGIVLVDVAGAGATAASHFSLDPASAGWRADPISADGVIDKGLFFYDLTLDGKQHKLVGLPDGEAFELATFGAALQSVWYSTTGSWFERQADLRTQLPSLDDSGAGVWMKITGSSADRDLTNSYDVFGVTYSFDTSYDQSTVALIAGLDYRGGGSGKAWVVGGQIGYVDSDVNFDASNTLTSFEGMTLGVYGTYVAGPLFVDAIVNANMLDYDLQVASLAPAGSNIFTGSVDSLGVQVEGGWTIPLGANGFFEPIGSLSYLSTSIDAVDVPGAQIDWDDQTSLRLSLGGRLGLTADHGTFSSKWALVARYWNEFEGENDVTLHSAGPDLTLGDDFSGSFGEIGGTVNVFGADDRFSAFLNVGVKFKDDYTSTDASLGLRWRW